MPIYDILESKANALQLNVIKEMYLCEEQKKKPVKQVDEKLQQNWTSFICRHSICVYVITRAHLCLIVMQ